MNKGNPGLTIYGKCIINYLIFLLIRNSVSFKQTLAQMIDIDPLSSNFYSEPVVEGINNISDMILLDDVSDFDAEGFQPFKC